MRKSSEIISAAGNIASPAEGMALTLTGEWTEHEKYGPQFSVVSAEMTNIAGKDAIIAYLSSGFIKGVGVVIARKIYKRFGEDTIRIIEDEPEKLAEVSGVSSRVAEQIHNSHGSGKAYMSLVSLLKPETTDYQIAKIYEKYGEKAIDVLNENPYQLIHDLDGVGFKKADRLAHAMGIKGDDPRRINAAVLHALHTAANDGGHCFMYADALETSIIELIGSVNMKLVAKAIEENVKKKDIIIDNEQAIYLRNLYFAETKAADNVRRLLDANLGKLVAPAIIEKAIIDVEAETGYVLEGKQKQAVKSALANGLSVITGGPGTGKTTIVKAILKAWELAGNRAESALLMAPTGKAARRMSEVTGRPAHTIHKALRLGYDGDTGAFTTEDPHPAGLVILDESSMLNIHIAASVVGAVKTGAILVLIGDADQLPPIGPGNFFRDMIESFKVPRAVLEVSYRQSGSIGINAGRVNSGQGTHSFICDDAFKYVNISDSKTNKASLADASVEEYMKLVDEYGVKDVCYLSPMRNKSSTGTNTINERIREIVHGDVIESLPSITVGKGEHERVFYLGDRIMQTDNDYEGGVYNGDIGFITAIEDGIVTAMFESGQELEYQAKDMGKLMLAYAVTVHKTQGSEYKAVVVVCGREHWYMAVRNLLYTALTRASEKVVLVGDARTISKAAGTVSQMVRNTKVKKRI
jgi:exodeoxyribonuclease V alpha subunit